MCWRFGNVARTTSTLNVPDGSSASWRGPPPQPSEEQRQRGPRGGARTEINTRRLSSAPVPTLPVPEGLRQSGIVLRRLRARDAGPFACAFRDDPGLGVLIGADEDPTEIGVRRFIARQPGPAGARGVPRPRRHRRHPAAVLRPRDAAHARLASPPGGGRLLARAPVRAARESGAPRCHCWLTGRSPRSSSTESRSPPPQTTPLHARSRNRSVSPRGRDARPEFGARQTRRRPLAGSFAQLGATVPV